MTTLLEPQRCSQSAHLDDYVCPNEFIRIVHSKVRIGTIDPLLRSRDLREFDVVLQNNVLSYHLGGVCRADDEPYLRKLCDVPLHCVVYDRSSVVGAQRLHHLVADSTHATLWLPCRPTPNELYPIDGVSVGEHYVPCVLLGRWCTRLC